MTPADGACCVQNRTAQSKIFVNNATTAALVKPWGRALVHGSSQQEIREPPDESFA